MDSYELAPADPATFTGTARSARLGATSDGLTLGVFLVEFEAGARTHWHRHHGIQLLLIREGLCRYQEEGRPPRDVAAGEVIEVQPGVLHWHGAAPGRTAAHLAINLATPRKTEWVRPVTDVEYRAT